MTCRWLDADNMSTGHWHCDDLAADKALTKHQHIIDRGWHHDDVAHEPRRAWNRSALEHVAHQCVGAWIPHRLQLLVVRGTRGYHAPKFRERVGRVSGCFEISIKDTNTVVLSEIDLEHFANIQNSTMAYINFCAQNLININTHTEKHTQT